MIWTGLFVGLAGSLHCVGMCGPIMLALPGKFSQGWGHLSGRLLYHGGRILTYSLLGGIAGMLGQGASWAGAEVSQVISITMGVLLLVATLVSWSRGGSAFRWPFLEKAMGKVKSALSRQLVRREKPSLFVIGVLNGLLPCGFVYLGLAGALTLGDALQSAGYMAFFGLGTIPLMLSFTLFGGFIREKLRGNTRPLLTAFAVIFSLMLIVRGLNLGIPYLSPSIAPSGEVVECH